MGMTFWTWFFIELEPFLVREVVEQTAGCRQSRRDEALLIQCVGADEVIAANLEDDREDCNIDIGSDTKKIPTSICALARGQHVAQYKQIRVTSVRKRFRLTSGEG